MSTSITRSTRRDFLRQSGGFFAGVSLASSLPAILPEDALAVQQPRAANDRIRIGHIGVGNQGRGNLRAHLRDTIAVCDVDRSRLAEAKAQVERANSGTCADYTDYRRLLDNRDVDAVVITTPDHWHALIAVHACQAGKDVYCEKPLTLTITEGRAIVRAARRHNRIVQTGSQQRSDERFRLACELIRSGRLGEVRTVRVGIPAVNFAGPPVPDSDPPAELNYDFWLGPAPQRPYNVKHVHYNFRFFWDYSGGQLTNWGAHHLDITQWALGMDNSGPVTIVGQASYHPERWYEVPQSFEVTYTYANGVRVICNRTNRGGVTFEGTRGTIHVNRGRLESNPPEIIRQALGEQDVHLYVSRNHHANWLECIRTRRPPICEAEIGHRSATVCHLGNIAIRSGRRITWDPSREEITEDSEAAAMVSRPYRAPWRMPELT
jgi:predicted dehydrogenase